VTEAPCPLCEPDPVAKTHGSWLGFVKAMDDVSTAFEGSPAGDFLKQIEITPMTKSYKMLTLLAMLNAGKFPGAISIEDLQAGFVRLARRNGTLRAEVGEALENASELRKLLEKNPIDAWTGGKGTGDQSFFRYDGRELRTTFDVPPSERERFQELTRELADWRLGEYLDQHHEPLEGIVCKVSHANKKPILFLPDRSTQAGIPDGWTPVDIDGDRYEANFVKVAVNVIRRPGNPRNELPTILRRWFGADTGLPGTNFHVVFKRSGTVWTLTPAGRRNDQALALWESYSRALNSSALARHLSGSNPASSGKERTWSSSSRWRRPANPNSTATRTGFCRPTPSNGKARTEQRRRAK